jgi:transposase InsO family protein
VVVSRKNIRKALKLHNLLDHDSSFDKQAEPKKGTRRFEADFPCELYQMDITNVYIEGIPVHYLVCIIDDYSRFCVAANLCDNQRSATLIECLHNASLAHGKAKKVLTDQGRGFYTWSMEQTLFQRYLDDNHIEHIVSDPHSPQTIGKVERFHQTIKKELLHKIRFTGIEDAIRKIHDYVRHYNFDRPHQGIGGARPSDRFYGVIGETSRIESELSGNNIDFSKGYLIFKAQDYTVSVVCSSSGLQVLLNGKVLKEGA